MSRSRWEPTEASSYFRWLSLLAILSACAAILLGTLLRLAQSGFGCPDWPLCSGQPISPPHVISGIEWAQRINVIVLAGLTGALLLFSRRPARALLRLLIMAVVLAAIQALLSLALLLERTVLPAPWLGVAQMSGIFLLLGILTSTAMRSWSEVLAAPRGAASRRLSALFLAVVISVFALLLSGVGVAGNNAALACPDWPLCRGELVPAQQEPSQTIHLFHRMTVVSVGVLLLLAAWEGRTNRVLFWLNGGTLVLYLTQVVLGGLIVLLELTPLAVIAHAGAAVAVWMGVTASATWVWQVDQEPQATAWQEWRSTAGTYFMLTKPYIVVLLLLTSLVAMFLAADGWPAARLIFFTMLGGALSAGGANALNSYIERDVDGVMSRTRRRPMPAGRVNPTNALIFAVTLNVTAFVVFAVFVNLLAAVIATAAMLYYVFVYTCWLKRSTHHNIVIGGAAGALPPLVGWAAVTGRIDLLALYLFAIIFYWTPPHTWALTLLVHNDYARARIPMLPVVVGEEETRRQIVLYTLLMIAITLVPAGLRLLGVAYLIAALVLGGLFLLYALQLRREPSKASARRLYKYSTLYLALLFLSMVIDVKVFLP